MKPHCCCDSGLSVWPLFDARHIFIAYVCFECVDKVKARYRPEIFTDSNYETDEPIEEDE